MLDCDAVLLAEPVVSLSAADKYEYEKVSASKKLAPPNGI